MKIVDITVNKKLNLLLIAGLAVALIAVSGCGGGGGGSTENNNNNNNSNNTTLKNGLDALSGSTPNYDTAKTQLSQVATDQNSTTADKTIAYSGLGWANVKSAANSSDIDKAIDSFSQAIAGAGDAGQTASSKAAIEQAYVGRSLVRAIKSSGNFINDAISDLDSAGYSDAAKQYSESQIKASVTNGEIKGYKAFLHYVRNGSSDYAQFQSNYAKLKENGATVDNIRLMQETFELMQKEN